MSNDQPGTQHLQGPQSSAEALSRLRLEQLAHRMRRPAESLQAFAQLTPEQLAALHELVDRACERRRHEFDTFAGAGLLRPFRRVVLRLLRGSTT